MDWPVNVRGDAHNAVWAWHTQEEEMGLHGFRVQGLGVPPSF